MPDALFRKALLQVNSDDVTNSTVANDFNTPLAQIGVLAILSNARPVIPASLALIVLAFFCCNRRLAYSFL
jgi:hypothetical protein